MTIWWRDIASTVDSNYSLSFMEYRGINAVAGVESDPNLPGEVGLHGSLGSNGFYRHLGFG